MVAELWMADRNPGERPGSIIPIDNEHTLFAWNSIKRYMPLIEKLSAASRRSYYRTPQGWSRKSRFISRKGSPIVTNLKQKVVVTMKLGRILGKAVNHMTVNCRLGRIILRLIEVQKLKYIFPLQWIGLSLLQVNPHRCKSPE